MTMPQMIPPEQLHEQELIAKALFQELAPRKLQYAIESYGCQMNAHDSEKLAGMLVHMGFVPAEQTDTADLILFNTCCVREHAEKRVFGNIGALKKRKDENPGLLIGVCGCMMQQPETAQRLFQRFPFVNFVFGTHSLHELPSIMQRVYNGERVYSLHDTPGYIVEGLPVLRAKGVSTSVNIMYGCNNFCSYCIVPYVRGRERSRRSEDILREVRELVAQGYSELTLLGQNVNSYGNDCDEISFAQLLTQLDSVDGLRRIRFMTSHPKDLSDALVDAMAQLDTVCKHIHLPVQSGSNRILHAMNRRYTREDYLKLVAKLRERVAGIELTTDIIVGFPTETEADFQDTLELMEQVGFAAAFTFMYSPRLGTKAATMSGQIEDAVKKERLLRLNARQEVQTLRNHEKYVGARGEALVEGFDGKRTNLAYGKLSNFKMVYFPGDSDMIGKYVSVQIEKIEKNSLIGNILTENMEKKG